MGRAAIPAVFLAFAAMVLYVFITVSTPVWNKVTFFHIDVPRVTVGNFGTEGGTISYGFLGWCFNDQCSEKDLGYRLEDPVNSIQGVNINIDNEALERITYTLILNPVSGLLSLLVTLFGLLAIRGGRITAIFLTIFEGFTAVVGCVTLALNVALFKVFENVLHDRLQDVGISITSSLDNAEWLSVAAAGCLIVGTVLSLLGICFGRSSNRRRDISYV
ncbi:hypothetical protein E3P99_02033 [Wallemia hederae]|uniref:Pali-domain-containing protein n=1 Tax=Wallemia hederae TaxID=1540922 RepID=A0A4T0FPT3_9BASI|nr:hypothetical protein E3P99_02033 [Wallemia hederae]